MRIGITERGDAGLDSSWIQKLPGVNGAILISKHPAKLLELVSSLTIPQLDKIIVHCTITGYGGSAVEPNVPRAGESIAAYKNLLEMFGPKRTVLRVDPVIPTHDGTSLANQVMEHAGGRIRVSFLDAYPHVRVRFDKAGLATMLPWDGLHAPYQVRAEALRRLTAFRKGRVEVCGELGFACTGCVSEFDLNTLHLIPTNETPFRRQRVGCACIAGKTELLTRKKQCPSGCLYCYWKD